MAQILQLNQPQKVTIVESIIEQVVAKIMDGTLKEGDKLPSERQLIETLHVSRSTVREALQGISAMGLVDIRHGEGTFVKEARATFGPNDRIEIHPRALQKEMRLQLNRARLTLELGIISEAISQMNETSARSIMLALNDYFLDHQEYPSVIDWSAHDNVHLTIAKATGNRFLIQMLQFLLGRVPQTLREGGMLLGNREEIKTNFDRDKVIHFGLCEAIMNKDEASARNWMMQHAQHEEEIINRYYGYPED
jgi:GntR family transcriptional regulator, transcriptional repressor for pyruvate dehydrogenase complex